MLDTKELGRALKSLPKTKPTSAPPGAKFMSVEDMIVAMDADGSGGVDVNEWLSNLSKVGGVAGRGAGRSAAERDAACILGPAAC